jgi:predicted phosphodiesterase
MSREKTYDRIFVWGDCHGDWEAVIRFMNKFDVRDSLIIQVGDFNIGYRDPAAEYTELRTMAMELGLGKNDLYVIRGNHDNPSPFNPDECGFYSNSRITFIPDYTYKTINKKEFLFVGGAISIDRQRSVQGLDYWKDEVFVLPDDYKNLKKCDVLITHSAPIEAFPIDGFERISHWFTYDPTLPQELIKEREDISTLFNTVEPKIHCYGHFHASNYEQIRGCVVKCLNINEFWEIKL